MPRYFFDIRDQDRVTFDEIGVDLPDLHAARLEARRTLGELMLENLSREGTGAVIIDIRMGSGNSVVEVVAASDDRDRH